MIETIVICGTSLALAVTASHAFHAWLAQRERERLSATDKAELLKKFVDVEGRLLELKNYAARTR